jgi:choline dehydrogenase
MDYDLIIVGGGSAGCPLAYRLAQAGARVLLLEAGGSGRHLVVRIPFGTTRAMFKPAFNWMYRTEPDASRGGRIDMWPAGRGLGGGSALNGMMFVRGHPGDYDGWSQLGNRGWSYAQVLPYFRRLESNERGSNQYRGESGPQRVSEIRVRHPLVETWLRAAEQAGIPRSLDLNGEAPEGVDHCQVTQLNGLRHSTAQAYLFDLPKPRSLVIKTNALADRAIIEDGRAVGVRYYHHGIEHSARADGVVFSAGTLASPALLMRSGIGPAEHLQDVDIPVQLDRPGVGENLQEHPGIDLHAEVTTPTLGSDRNLLRDVRHALSLIFKRRGPLTSPIGFAQALTRGRPEEPLPNLQLVMQPFAFDAGEYGVAIARTRLVTIAIGVLHPGSRGRLRLRSPDPLAKPIIEHQLLGADRDVDQLIDGLRLARTIFEQDAFAKVFARETQPGQALQSKQQLEDYVRQQAFPMYHPVGTCKMGSDEQAVVDERLRVRGIERLWIADASIMPTLIGANTNATAIMIGEKAADLIAAEPGLN